jgi:hypothetical protein
MLLRSSVALAPIAQLVERTAYTRRELQIGARLEVRVLLGVLSPSSMKERPLRKRGGRVFKSRRTTKRKVVRSGAQPVSKAGPTSGSRVRLLHLPPFRAAVIRHGCAWVGWALASPRRCKRPASAVVVQFHPYPPGPIFLGRLFAIAAAGRTTRTWLNGRVPERHSGGVGSTPAVRAN